MELIQNKIWIVILEITEDERQPVSQSLCDMCTDTGGYQF
jgi:hypothetical protein